MLTLLGIRHHGPGSARSVLAALERLQPDCLLVEGPPEANHLLPLLAEADTRPPIAILLYRPEAPQQAAFYPLAEFSPEWQAIRWALACRVPVRWIDLEQTGQLSARQEPPAGEARPKEDNPASPPSEDLFSLLARAAGYADGEHWWERFIEHRRETGSDVFTGILELMSALRANTERTHTPAPLDLAREAAMRTHIRAAQREGFRNIAVVCGAWHAPALLHLESEAEDQNVLTNFLSASASSPRPPDHATTQPRDRATTRLPDYPTTRPRDHPANPVSATIIPWTYDRLAQRSGYRAGIPAPGWYEHLWENQTSLVERWMVKAAHLLRAEDLPISPGHAIEAARLAEALAALRGYPLPGLAELEEALQAVFCFGEDAPLRLIRERLVIGQRMGQVPASAPATPLQRDLNAAQKRLRLQPSAASELLDLDLRKPLQRERSQLLHRLNLLGIPWGRLHAARGAKGTFHELWQIEWQPEFSVRLIEASILGNTVREAALHRLEGEAARAAELPALTHLVESALLAELPESIPPLMARVQALTAVSSDLPHLMGALPPLFSVIRYGSVRQTETGLVRRIVEELLLRICIGLPTGCSALEEEAAREMSQHIREVHRSLSLLFDSTESARAENHQPQRLAWLHALRRLAEQETTPGLLRGLACRLLYDAGSAEDEEIRQWMSRALSPGTPAMHAAAWLEGFLHSGGQALIHTPALWQMLDAWVSTLSETAFLAALPLLRRAFSAFPPAERRQLGERLRHSGQIHPAPGQPALHPLRAQKALALINRILGEPAR
ncbi:MAG: hypothetical protein DDG60_07670 [Anaerolineae bacterium]|nr:MAG: hypothetical protein DDG60_07670 [Anaerolineae bacterium]